MADTASEAPTQGPGIPGQPDIVSFGTTPDFAGLGGEAPTGGLPAVLDSLRDAAEAHDDAAEAHDDELTGLGGLDSSRGSDHGGQGLPSE
jgi:hypothetical protein